MAGTSWTRRATRRVPKDPDSGLNKRYVHGLTRRQKQAFKRSIAKTRRAYLERGVVLDRPFPNPAAATKATRSKFMLRFEKLYGFSATDLQRVKGSFADTDVDGILAKGLGAYATSGSRNTANAHMWAYARLASVLTGGKSFYVDRNLVGPRSLAKMKSNGVSVAVTP